MKHLRVAISDSIEPKVFLMGTYSKSSIESTLTNLIRAYSLLTQDESLIEKCVSYRLNRAFNGNLYDFYSEKLVYLRIAESCLRAHAELAPVLMHLS